MKRAHRTETQHGARGAAFIWMIAPLIGLAACAGSDGDGRQTKAHLGADFGNAVTHNATQHVIDSAPERARAGAPPMDGARAAQAFTRYREGAVTSLDAVETTDFGDER